MNQPELILSEKQIDQIYIYATQIVDNLPPRAINELLEGYNHDQTALLNEIILQVNNVVNFGHTLETEKLSYLDSLEESMDGTLKKLSFNYFIATCLPNFTLGWRNLEMGNLMQLYPWSVYLAARGHGKSFMTCYALPLWRLYSYDKPAYFSKDSVDNRNRKETMLITNESTLGVTHLAKIIEEINNNDILKEKLNPNNKELGKTGFSTETGSLIKLRSLFSSGIRGAHIGLLVGDDILSESSLYSKEQRAKAKEILYGSMVPTVEPGGYMIISGTPFSEGDLYSDLKKDPNFKVFEYPCISPYYEKGKLSYRLLAPDRFTYKDLLNIKESIGSSVFSREYMVSPVTDDSSIFPYEYLNKCIEGMENISFATNIQSFPFKLDRVVVGCDFAKSGSIGADRTVYSVWGIDSNENYYLVYLWSKTGASHLEQVNQIVSLDQRFKPQVIVCEANGFQGIISDLAKQRGLRNIVEFTTTGFNKKNSYEGLPSLGAIMERGQIRVPFKEGETKEIVQNWMSEFNSISFNEDNGKLESVGEHDDMAMSTFFAIQELRTKTSRFRFHQV